jgi:hypothetical protein
LRKVKLRPPIIVCPGYDSFSNCFLRLSSLKSILPELYLTVDPGSAINSIHSKNVLTLLVSG